MKIFKILICVTFLFVISSCHNKDNIYDYPDDDPAAEKGNVGDKCEKNTDCKEGLLCIDKVCSEPVTDKDTVDDSDSEPDEDGDEPADDADSDKNDSDSDKDTPDNNDTTPDEDEPDDADTPSDDDTDKPVYIPECGNGLRDPGEECDNGAENSDEPGTPGTTCRTNCTLARCQDGIVDSGEICDDGNPSVGDYCSPDCHVITGYCGDGIIQSNEACDNAKNPYCADDCSQITGSCGDGIKQSNEACDNAEPDVGAGEGIGSEYCNVNCSKIIGSCGDGIVQLNEECDDGNFNGRYGYCKSDCSGKGPYCGDGIKQSNEACDKAEPGAGGGEGTGLYCSSDCKTSKGSCGDGIIQSFEACDTATYNQGTGRYCSNDCAVSFGRCGDGTRNQDNSGNWLEECDNGDLENQNRYCPYGSAASCEVCNRACEIQSGIPRYCGDGVVSTLSGEACDPANFDDPKRAYCKDDCSQYTGYCGDGILQTGIETCDPGLNPYCTDDCSQVIGSCGDGTINGDEECDNGENNGKTECPYGEKTGCTVCSAECKNTAGRPRYCGDGLTDNGYENCDSGKNGGNYGYCKADCTGLAEHCGDGIINGDEICDYGENNGKTECAYGEESCKVCSKSCEESDGKTAYCGDGIINGNESCDDGENNGSYGYCRAGCYGEGERCGDGKVNGDEICDDGADNGKYGFCASDCLSPGRRCGDGIIEKAYGEYCDDGENNGKYKNEKPGYCNETCTAYGDGGYCGDGEINGDETCDNGSNNNLKCAYGETSCDVCNSMCLKQPGITSYCGDGNLDWLNDEVCDKGSENTDYDGECNKNCSGVPPRCGDGNIDEAFGEVCDDMANNGNYSSSLPAYCSIDCKSFGGGGYCGDGKTNGYETCDSGAMNGYYGGFCNDSCSGYTHKCGDGYLDTVPGENCDDGVNNGKYGYCDNECTAKLKCGDGIWQKENCNGADGCIELENAEEECDNGILNGKISDCAYGEKSCKLCSDSCSEFDGNTAYCSDGIIQRENCEGYGSNCVEVPGANEVCDDGILHNGSYGHCNTECNGSMQKCGDGIINRENCEGYGSNCTETEGVNEECDDGNLNGTYGKCNRNCSGTVRCGDGSATDGEFCDDGLMNGKYNFCNKSCTAKTGFCGDGKLQKEIGSCGDTPGCIEMEDADEECDRGSANGSTTECSYGETSCTLCTKSCTVIAGETHYCGDGITDTEKGENCDDGDENGQFGKCDESCSGTVTWQCGDGVLDELHGEICDYGIDPHCNLTCDGWLPYCGDGRIQRPDCSHWLTCNGTDIVTDCCEVYETMSERCDDGELNDSPGYCYGDCSGYCGDGTVQSDYEACDDGRDNGQPEHCNRQCDGLTSVCGNGIVEYGENCDDGNTVDGDYCSSNCRQITGRCGDGTKQDNEACDEGEDNNGYHGHCNEECSGTSICGDGKRGKDEYCDGTEMIGEIPCSMLPQFAFTDETIIVNSCTSDCRPVLSQCTYNTLYTNPFFTTGQTLCYNNTGTTDCHESALPFFGQEPEFEYTAHSYETIEKPEITEETIKDNATELMWQRYTPSIYEGEIEGYHFSKAEGENWEARYYCRYLTLGGYDDWRLPTAAELSTIADYSSATHIYSNFTNTVGSYWTDEGLLFSSTDGTFTPSTGSDTAKIKCVRSVNESGCTALQCQEKKDESMFVFDSPHTLITASLIKNNSVIFNFWYFDSLEVGDTWEHALAFCQGIGKSEHDDNNGLNNMRLPTVNELMWLIDWTNGGSLIPGFTGRAWTSTTVDNVPAAHPLYPNANSHAYAVDFSTGSVTYEPKTNSNIIICIE